MHRIEILRARYVLQLLVGYTLTKFQLDCTALKYEGVFSFWCKTITGILPPGIHGKDSRNWGGERSFKRGGGGSGVCDNWYCNSMTLLWPTASYKALLKKLLVTPKLIAFSGPIWSTDTCLVCHSNQKIRFLEILAMALAPYIYICKCNYQISLFFHFDTNLKENQNISAILAKNGFDY